jgi:hypothetical protein
MYIPFDLLPHRARLWIYQAGRKLTEVEERVVTEELQVFCALWVAHGNPLNTSFKIERGQFLILAVDEGVTGASGCSIDGSVRLLKSLNDRMGIDFLSHSRVPFLIDGEVKLIPVRELKEAFTTGILGPDTPTFHMLAATKEVWERSWILSAEKTWLAQYLPKTPVT